MRYHGNKICPEERTNEQTNKHGRRTAQKHNAFVDTIGWQKASRNCYIHTLTQLWQNVIG